MTYSQPINIAPQPVVFRPQPVYLYVPPGHQKNWANHRSLDDACSQPVCFVQENWIREHQEEQHREQGDGRAKKEEKQKG